MPHKPAQPPAMQSNKTMPQTAASSEAKPLNEANILALLRTIEDPDLKKDIVSAGFIKALSITEATGRVALTLELTTPACPFKEQFKTDAAAKIKTLSGVTAVEVTLTSSKNKAAAALQQAASGLKDVDCLIAIASCKGGVGKSTVAALIACELAQQGHAVGLLDADLFGPSLPTLFHSRTEGIRMFEKRLLPLELPMTPANQAHTLSPAMPVSEANATAPKTSTAKLKLMSFGFLLGDAPAIMRGAMVSNYMNQVLHQVAWGQLDYLIIDLPPGTGDTVLTLAQSVQLTGAIIVTTPASLSLVDVARGMHTFNKVNVPMAGIIENMAYFICSECDAKHYIFERGQQTLSERFGVPTLAKLPLFSATAAVPATLKTSAPAPAALPFNFNPYRLTPDVQGIVKNMITQTARAIGTLKGSTPELPKIDIGPALITLRFKSAPPQTLSFKRLRLHCPCALCQDEFTGNRKLTESSIPADLKALSVKAIGHYALGIDWSDGHRSGIYPYKLFAKLAATENAANTVPA